jgi:hypothetical protein
MLSLHLSFISLCFGVLQTVTGQPSERASVNWLDGNP